MAVKLNMNVQQNVLEQFEELYSRWSVLDKVSKEMQFANMWLQLSATYNYICRLYQRRGYLTIDESNYANQIYQMLVGLNTQKMKVDMELTDEMIKHLIKMKAKQM